MNFYKKIVDKFPKKSYSFAYGSGVKAQLGYSVGQDKLIDFIFSVDNPLEWHSKNLKIFEDHYSGFKILGSNSITSYQKKFGAQVYFNTLVQIQNPNARIKYGIISTEDLIQDLECWNSLYVAGRLHKPVTVTTDCNNPNIHQALQKNLQSAFRTALILLPEKFSNYELFYTISNLSYRGDFRMIFGENKNKVHNIVKPQIEEFQKLYKSIIEDFRLSRIGESDLNIFYQQDKKKTIEYVNELPITVIEKLKKFSGQNDIKQLVKDLDNLQKLLRRSVDSIVWNSSVSQSIKNIPTAGVTKTIMYSWKKFLKTFS